MEYIEWLEKNWDRENIFPPALDAQTALDILQNYLLNEDWYSVNPINKKQINSEITEKILYKYSRKYRKEKKEYLKWKR